MTEDQFDASLKHIEEQTRAMQACVDAYRDQQMARLFIKSGWTQERIANRLGKSQQWIVTRLRFGRFLQFTTACSNSTKPPKNLTEDRFRGYFERTSKETKEPRRFAEVLRLMEDDVGLRRARPATWVGRKVAEDFSDQKWRAPKRIAETIHASLPDVVAVLEAMRITGSHERHCVSRPAGKGKGLEYKITKGGGKKIDLKTFRVEVSPIIKQLEIEAQKNIARFSPPTLIHLIHKLKVLLDKLAK